MLYLLTAASLFAIGYSFPCCVIHDGEQACGAEGSGVCVWLGENHPLYLSDASLGAKCVSEPWYLCETGVYCPPAPIAPPAAVSSGSNCYLTPCVTLTVEYNVAFIIDESGSVGSTNYKNSLKFVENMVTNNIQDNANISMLAFASGTDRIYKFSDSQRDQRAGALRAIADEKNDYNGGMTCMPYALQLLIDEIDSDPNVTPDDKNLLFLMTDGKPNCGGNVCDYRAELDARGVTTYVIGVGSGFSRNDVRCLVELDTRIINIASFSTEDFYRIESQLRNTVCPIVWEEGLFAQITGFMYDYGYNNGSISFWVIFVGFVVAALIYWNKERVCKRGQKYQPIIDDEPSYGATTSV